MNTQRPVVLSAGILLTALLTSCYLALTFLAGIVGLGAGGYALAQGEDTLGLGLLMGAGAVAFLGWTLLLLLLLYACARAWNGSRGWTTVLLIVSVLGLLNPGPISLPIQVLTIVGAALALNQANVTPRPLTSEPGPTAR